MNNNPFSTRTLKLVGAGILAASLIAGTSGCSSDEAATAGPASQPSASSGTASESTRTIRAAFVKVIDGQTIEVQPSNENDGQPSGEPNITVRLIGVKAPAAGECGADEAVEHLTSLLLSGEPMDITFDAALEDSADEGGVIQAYASTVTVGTRDTGRAMISDGYAVTDSETGPAHERTAEYEDEEQWASTESKGLWDTCGNLNG